MNGNILKSRGFQYVELFAGCGIIALAMNIFLVPNKIAPGGVTGIATVLFYVTGGLLPVGITMLILNIPLFILGFKNIGKEFIFRSIMGAALLSVFIDITGPFIKKIINDSSVSGTNPDLLLYSISGGFIMGVGLGLVFRTGATTGGTDLAAALLHRIIPGFSMGQLLLSLDAIVIVFASITFKSFKLGLYAIISMFVATKMIDALLEGVNYAKGLFIITEKPQEISQSIFARVERGVTAFYAKGMYSGIDKFVLLCIVKRKEIQLVKAIIKDLDPQAFVVLADIREVLGEGFGSRTI